LQEKVNELTLTRDHLQKQIEKFTFTCDQSRQQLEEIIAARDKLKKQVVELSELRDKLQRRYNELNASHTQLSKQVQQLTRSRNEAVAQVQTAQKRIEALVSILDSEKREFSERQERLTVTTQTKEDTQTPMVKISEYPAAPAKLSRPAVQKQDVRRPSAPAEVVEAVVVDKQIEECPTCNSFSTNRPRILPGQTSILSWQVSNAEQIRIEPDIGLVSALGSVAVKPSEATTYRLIATNHAGERIQTCRIEVGRSLTIGSDGTAPRTLSKQDLASSDKRVLSAQQIPVGDPNATLGKFLGYRARRDESGKFVFIPVYENKQEE